MNTYQIIAAIGFVVVAIVVCYALWTVTMIATRDHHKKEKHA